ncbi:MAG: hypothetical protein ACRCZD_13950 [Phycicoccus sp.]
MSFIARPPSSTPLVGVVEIRVRRRAGLVSRRARRGADLWTGAAASAPCGQRAPDRGLDTRLGVVASTSR